MTNTQLLKKIAHYLRLSQMMVAVAESCTGGLLAASLTKLSGSSTWFERGFVTYSNAAKKELLGVTEQTLALYGAVSAQTAQAMAKGALKHSQAGIAVAITGIAGPLGGSAEKPVGTVWLGLADKNGISKSYLQIFYGSRAMVRKKAVHFALELLHDYFLKEKK